MTATLPNDTAFKLQYPGALPEEYGLVVRVVEVTPAMAAEWLKPNLENRPVNDKHLAEIARDMGAGRWDLTAEPIIWDCNGVLRDGQHRLTSCVRTGRSFRTLVVWGVLPSSSTNMGQGTRRTNADMLGIMRVENYSLMAGIAALVFNDEQGRSLGVRGVKPTHEEALDIVDRLYDDIKPSFRWAKNSNRLGFTSPSLACFLHWKLATIDRPAADAFFAALCSGAGLELGNPILPLIQAMRSVSMRGGVKHRTSVVQCSAYVIKAWNAWSAGKELRLLRWTPAEEFPQPSRPTTKRWMA